MLAAGMASIQRHDCLSCKSGFCVREVGRKFPMRCCHCSTARDKLGST